MSVRRSHCLLLCFLLASPVSAQFQEILGGNNALPGKWPSIAALVHSAVPDNYDAHFCGGSLIHPSWVVTAAHCMEGETNATVQVLIGINDLNDPTAVRHNVSEIIVHPFYNPTTLENDIALLRLTEPSLAPTIPLAVDLALETPGVQATVMGWGALDAGETQYPNLLQELGVPVVSHAAANQFFVYNGDVTANMLAAGFLNSTMDSCVGDSGGPLVTWNAAIHAWVQIGVVSWGEVCGQKYGVYTRVTNFRDWALFYTMRGYLAYEQGAGVRGLLQDPDGDGYGNYLEYAHNSDAKAYRPEFKPTVSRVNVAGAEYAAISYRRIRDTPIVKYMPEVTADLGQSWVPLDPAAMQVGAPIIVDAFTDLVTVRDSAPISPGIHRFLRVRAGVLPVP